MTREQFEEMSLDELLEWAYENVDDLTTEDVLIEFAKSKIDDSDFNVAMHILVAIWESEVAYNDYYIYDYNMGTCETPTPVTCKEDLEDYIDFDEEDTDIEVRKYSNKLMELVETGVLDPVDVVRMCVKWMSEDDVQGMMEANEIEYDYEPEEDEEDEED
jgi:hypothetical protein